MTGTRRSALSRLGLFFFIAGGLLSCLWCFRFWRAEATAMEREAANDGILRGRMHENPMFAPEKGASAGGGASSSAGGGGSRADALGEAGMDQKPKKKKKAGKKHLSGEFRADKSGVPGAAPEAQQKKDDPRAGKREGSMKKMISRQPTLGGGMPKSNNPRHRSIIKKKEGQWTEHFDPTSKATFFHNATTGETTWTRPPEMGAPKGRGHGLSVV